MDDRAAQTTGELDRLLGDLTRRAPTPQAIMAVESGDRSFRWFGAEGVTATGARVVEDTPFFIASIDKLYNATVTMMLGEAKRLSIDDPICAYLPPAVTRGLHRHRGQDLSEKVTIRHLLTHTSGIADWFEDRPRGGPSLFERIIEEGDRAITLEELAAHVRDRLRPHFPPQDLSRARPRVRYSDTNFMLVTAIIEAVTGQPLQEVHRRLLHEPLGLRCTYFAGHGAPSRPSTEMPLHASGRPLSVPLLIESTKGICATATDLMAFMRALTRGEVFRDPGTLIAMQGTWRRFGFPLDRAAARSPGWPIEYGLGLMRFRLPRLLTPAAPMPVVLGHTGSTGCWLFHCPELDVLLAGSVNDATAGAVPFRAVPRILDILRTSGRRRPGPARSGGSAAKVIE